MIDNPMLQCPIRIRHKGRCVLNNMHGGKHKYPGATPTDEAVHHPSHYGGADNPFEVIKVIRAWGLAFNLGNSVKYIARAGKKDPAKLVEDLEKAAFYLADEIAALKREQSNG